MQCHKRKVPPNFANQTRTEQIQTWMGRGKSRSKAMKLMTYFNIVTSPSYKG